MTDSNTRKPTKLCVKKKWCKDYKLALWINKEAANNLLVIHRFYSKVLGRDVSNSVIMRRAIGCLVDQIGKLLKEKNIEKIQAEGIIVTRFTR